METERDVVRYEDEGGGGVGGRYSESERSERFICIVSRYHRLLLTAGAAAADFRYIVSKRKSLPGHQ